MIDFFWKESIIEITYYSVEPSLDLLDKEARGSLSKNFLNILLFVSITKTRVFEKREFIFCTILLGKLRNTNRLLIMLVLQCTPPSNYNAHCTEQIYNYFKTSVKCALKNVFSILLLTTYCRNMILFWNYYLNHYRFIY